MNGIVITLLISLLLLFGVAVFFIVDYLDKMTFLLGHIAWLLGEGPSEEGEWEER